MRNDVNKKGEKKFFIVLDAFVVFLSVIACILVKEINPYFLFSGIVFLLRTIYNLVQYKKL